MITQLYDRSSRKLVLIFPMFSDIEPKVIENVLPDAVFSIVNIHNMRLIHQVLSRFLENRKKALTIVNQFDQKTQLQFQTVKTMLDKIQESQLAKIVNMVTNKQLTLYAIAPGKKSQHYSNFITKVFPVIQWCEQMASAINNTPLKRNPCQGRQG